MEQLVILVIIGLISLVNWILQKSAEKREAAKMKREAAGGDSIRTRRNIYTQPAPAGRRPPAPAPSGRDPLKDLMEALGLPSDALPPPPVQREVVPDQIGEQEEFISLEDAAPPPLPAAAVRKMRVPPLQPPARPSRPDEKTARLASAFAAGEQKAHQAHGGVSVRALLAGRTAQRQAVIMAEILGTPRGLAPAAAWLVRG